MFPSGSFIAAITKEYFTKAFGQTRAICAGFAIIGKSSNFVEWIWHHTSSACFLAGRPPPCNEPTTLVTSPSFTVSTMAAADQATFLASALAFRRQQWLDIAIASAR